jgi:hypothetical protein
MIPLLVRYFSPDSGLQTIILEFTDLPGETAEELTNYVWTLLKNLLKQIHSSQKK